MSDTTSLDGPPQPGTLVPASGETDKLVPVDYEHPVAAEGHAHPGPREYVLVAMVLVVLTAAEVGLSYLDGLNSNFVITMLVLAAAAKFVLVCAWYMHMKQDLPFFRRVFVIGLVGATVIYGIVLFMFASTVLLD